MKQGFTAGYKLEIDAYKEAGHFLELQSHRRDSQ